MCTRFCLVSVKAMPITLELSRACQCCSVLAGLILLLLTLMLHDMLLPTPDVPTLPDRWWGQQPKPSGEEDASIRPFKLEVSEETLQDLHRRIDMDLKRIVPPLQGIGFQYGANSDYMRSLAHYWKHDYRWRDWEKVLNALPQFMTNVTGIELHYMHVKPKDVSPTQRIVPLLLVHGWPGSLVEFLEFVPLLAKGNDNVAVEVVAPHIPGYGFSSAPAHAGFSAIETAKMFRDLMLRLGHEKFYTQGGDWGSHITTAVATFFPESVLGIHLTMPIAATPGTLLKNILLQLPLMKYLLVDAADYHKLNNNQYTFLLKETGYFHIQATKPDSVGMALSSSPVGLAAYIFEKFSTWTNPDWTTLADGGLDNHTIAKDRMLTNVMLYWLSNCITSSQRFYKENMRQSTPLANIPVRSPTGIADAPNELFLVPRSVLKGKFPNIVQYTRLESGGHFTSMEIPEVMATDVLQFIGKVEDLGPHEQEL